MPDRDNILLPSGREFYANCGIVGISAEGEVTEGYDGGVPGADGDSLDGYDNWSPVECRELADLMITRWQAYRSEHGA